MPSAASHTWPVSFCRSSDLRLGQGIPAFAGLLCLLRARPQWRTFVDEQRTSRIQRRLPSGILTRFPCSAARMLSCGHKKLYCVLYNKKRPFLFGKAVRKPTVHDSQEVLSDIRSLPADASRRTRPFASDSHQLMIKSTCITQVSHRICCIFIFAYCTATFRQMQDANSNFF